MNDKQFELLMERLEEILHTLNRIERKIDPPKPVEIPMPPPYQVNLIKPNYTIEPTTTTDFTKLQNKFIDTIDHLKKQLHH